MTNQTDQGVTIDRDVQLLLDLVDDYGLSRETGDIKNARHELRDMVSIAQIITNRLTQPAPPVPGVERSVIERAIESVRYANGQGYCPNCGAWSEPTDIALLAEAVMNALAQTGEGERNDRSGISM